MSGQYRLDDIELALILFWGAAIAVVAALV